MTSLCRCARRRCCCCCCCCCLTIGHRMAAKANYKRPTMLPSWLLAAKTSDGSNGWCRCAMQVCRLRVRSRSRRSRFMNGSVGAPRLGLQHVMYRAGPRHKRPTWLAVDRRRTVIPCDVYTTTAGRRRSRAPAVRI